MCLNPGDTLRDGRYQIIAELGCGGFGRTYTAKDLENSENTLCVIKEIRRPQSTDPLALEKAKQLFEKEARNLVKLGEHPRIPTFIQHFEENQRFYIVQEYIDGHPLKDEFIANHRWTEEQVTELLRDILEIIKFVHDKKVIHRDITPSNLIRRNSDRKLVLIDFGAVKEIGTIEITASGQTRTTTIGTPGYSPPEQLDGQPRFCSDIYSIGMIAIQFLTGLHPQQLPRDPRTDQIIWNYWLPNQPMLQVSNRFAKVLDKMVRNYFPNRYQSAAQVLKKLGATTSWWLVGFAVAIAGVAVASTIAVPRIFPKKFPPPSASNPLPPVLGDSISSGEEILVTTSAHWSKQRGIIEFARLNYQESLKLLKQSWSQYRKDPETLIYMNNALLEAKKVPYYTIAIIIPTRRNPEGKIVNSDLAEELLRGIAQAQTEVNLGLLADDWTESDFPGQGFLSAKSINGKGLKVIVADDGNIKSEAVKRANALVKIPDILGVVGHYTSDMTVETVDIYDRNKLVLVSPGSTTEELTRLPRKFFFRTAPRTSSESEGLVNFLIEAGIKRVAAFYNPNSPFTASLWEEFKKQFEAKGGTFIRIREFEDLSKSDFNAEKAIEAVQKIDQTAILVIPDGQVTNALENALEMIKINRNYNWIVGPWTLYDPKTLKTAKQLPSFDKIVISVHWHPLSSKNKKFPQDVIKLWGGAVNTRTALTYDATKAMIKAIEMQSQPSHEGMQKMLSEPNFMTEGATGTIQFEQKTGDRKNPPQQLAHIVECRKEEFGVTFVPIEFPTAAAAGLQCE
jgi:eukaryotic-like serine/threonine-protein kinase